MSFHLHGKGPDWLPHALSGDFKRTRFGSYERGSLKKIGFPLPESKGNPCCEYRTSYPAARSFVATYFP